MQGRYRFPFPRRLARTLLLSLTNGDPLAVEKLVGRGRVIIQAVPLRLQWSELARSQAFVVMVQDWLGYLTQPLATRHNLAPGEPIGLQLKGSEIHEATLRTPQGDDIELTGEPTTAGVIFRTSRTIQPGDYSLETGLADDKIPFHVHRDSRESNLAPLTTAEVQRIAEISGLSRMATSSSSQSSTPSMAAASDVGDRPDRRCCCGSMSRGRSGASSDAPCRKSINPRRSSYVNQFAGQSSGQADLEACDENVTDQITTAERLSSTALPAGAIGIGLVLACCSPGRFDESPAFLNLKIPCFSVSADGCVPSSSGCCSHSADPCKTSTTRR